MAHGDMGNINLRRRVLQSFVGRAEREERSRYDVTLEEYQESLERDRRDGQLDVLPEDAGRLRDDWTPDYEPVIFDAEEAGAKKGSGLAAKELRAYEEGLGDIPVTRSAIEPLDPEDVGGTKWTGRKKEAQDAKDLIEGMRDRFTKDGSDVVGWEQMVQRLEEMPGTPKERSARAVALLRSGSMPAEVEARLEKLAPHTMEGWRNRMGFLAGKNTEGGSASLSRQARFLMENGSPRAAQALMDAAGVFSTQEGKLKTIPEGMVRRALSMVHPSTMQRLRDAEDLGIARGGKKTVLASDLRPTAGAADMLPGARTRMLVPNDEVGGIHRLRMAIARASKDREDVGGKTPFERISEKRSLYGQAQDAEYMGARGDKVRARELRGGGQSSVQRRLDTLRQLTSPEALSLEVQKLAEGPPTRAVAENIQMLRVLRERRRELERVIKAGGEVGGKAGKRTKAILAIARLLR